jgi:hypothetical protein
MSDPLEQELCGGIAIPSARTFPDDKKLTGSKQLSHTFFCCYDSC